jgi:hypothetical protein
MVEILEGRKESIVEYILLPFGRLGLQRNIDIATNCTKGDFTP